MKKLFLCLLLSSCVSVPPTQQVIEKEKQLSPFPPISIQEYTRKPIINSVDNNFVVSDEFVTNSLKYKKWVDHILEWKKLNNIK